MKTMEEYLECKSMLFKQCNQGILNADDENWKNMIKDCVCEVKTYACNNKADLMGENIEFIKEKGKIGIKFNTSGELQDELKVFIPGNFSVYNSLATLSLCNCLDINENTIINALAVVQVKGRVELLNVSDKFTLLIDYAHKRSKYKKYIDYPKRIQS